LCPKFADCISKIILSCEKNNTVAILTVLEEKKSSEKAGNLSTSQKSSLPLLNTKMDATKNPACFQRGFPAAIKLNSSRL